MLYLQATHSFNFIGVYASVNSSSQLGAVTDYIKDFFASFLNKYYLILIPFAILLLYYAFIDGRLKYRGNKRFVLRCHVDHEPILRTILSLFLIFIFVITFKRYFANIQMYMITSLLRFF